MESLSGISHDTSTKNFCQVSTISIFEDTLNSILGNNIGQAINEITDLVKCYICLERIKHPKMCKFCHRLVCNECIRKWLEQKNMCGFCRHQITRFDFTEVPFIENIEKLIDNYKDLEDKNTSLEKRNEELKQQLNSNKCNKHNEKILYYCFNCNIKLCGKCTSFTSKEAKKHQFHKVYEFSEIEKTNYLDAINLLENAKEQMYETDKILKRCEKIKKNNEKKSQTERNLIERIYKEIEKNHVKNNQINSSNIKKLNNFQNEFNEKLNNVSEKLQKIESLEKPINNLNINEEKKDIEKSKEKLIKMEQKINDDLQKNIYLELKSFNYIFNKTYKNILNEKTISINIEKPLKIDFTLELINNDILYIFFPVSLLMEKEILTIKKKVKVDLVPLIQINDKIKEFKKMKKSLIDDMILKNKKEKFIDDDEVNEKEIIDIMKNLNTNEKNKNINKNIIIEKNKNFIDYDNESEEYVLKEKLSKLIKDNNRFELFVYYYYFYNNNPNINNGDNNQSFIDNDDIL